MSFRPQLVDSVHERVSELVQHIHELEQELFSITGGQIDAIARFSLLPDAQANLLVREATFRAIFDHAGIGIALLDGADSRLLQCNRTLAAMLGYPYDGLTDRTLADLVHPEELARAADEWRNFCRSGSGKLRCEGRYRRKDGSYTWGKLTATAVQMPQGTSPMQYVIAILEDISARKLAQAESMRVSRALTMLSRCNQALTRATNEATLLEEIARAIVEVGRYRLAWVDLKEDGNNPAAIVAVEFGQESISPGFHEALRLANDKEDSIATRAFRLNRSQVTWEKPGQAHAQVERQLREHGLNDAIAIPITAERRVLGVLVVYLAEPAEIPNEELALLDELARDLGFGIAALRSRAARRIENERMRDQASLLNLVHDAIVVRDLDNRILYWNRGAEELYGWAAAEAIGKDSTELKKPDMEVYEAGMRTVRECGEWSGEIVEFKRDWTAVVVHATWTLVPNAAGKGQRVFSIGTDITERKRAEEAILALNSELERRVAERTAALVEANKQLEAFSYSVSHDLRNPLSTIDGFSALLERQPLPEKDSGYLRRIRLATAHMSRLIDGLLLLGRVSRRALRRESVDLSKIARRTADELHAAEPGRAVEMQIAPGLLAQGDPDLLAIVLDNMLGNAWKYSAHRKPAQIRFGKHVGAAGEAVFFVRDNGAGFDSANATTLFEPFHRFHTDAEFPGTGVGLATAKRIVERHNGRIWAESQPEQGATLYFTLPGPSTAMTESAI